MSLTAELFGTSASPLQSNKGAESCKGTTAAVSFEPTKKAAFDIFAVAPQVKKSTRREKERLLLEKNISVRKNAGTTSHDEETNDKIFRTLFVEDLTSDNVGKEGSRRQRRRKHMSHALQENSEEDARTVFVGNLVNDVKRRTVEKIFKSCGTIESLRIRGQAVVDEGGVDENGTNARQRKVGRAIHVLRGDVKKGEHYSAVAYVLFKDKSSIQEALKKNGIVVEGRHIVVTTMDPESREYAPETSVFIGNIAYDTNEEAVRNFFVERGILDVKRIRLVRDRSTGDCKGFGYVEFESKSSVPRAIAVRGSLFCDREIRIVHVQKSKAVTLSKVSRREKRKHDTQATSVSSSAGSTRNSKKRRTEEGAKGHLAAGDQPSWMGVVTNPRKKIPKDLRPLVEGRRSVASPRPRVPVKHKVRNPEKGG
uniref:Putative RNA binding protein n=1 Tax=Trypanosoma congolense (strain IL3000) TaxID=1068625 RepID=G0UUT8_TRYCI|nr:putative RNA binding protein [Trypanosoma congolense IL3000]